MKNKFGAKSLKEHKKLGGKISVISKIDLDSKDKLSTYYTPGVGAVSQIIGNNPTLASEYTWINNSVAVISDGSAVLGLGNIGPKASLPVLEGKCMIFKQFAGIDAVPIALDVHSVDEIVKAVLAIAPSFGGINLEDIAAPGCFEILKQLEEKLDIPVFHDDQLGTAIVVLAGLINACRVAKKDLGKSKVVLIGAGAAGNSIATLIHAYCGNCQIVVVDSVGIISKDRTDLNKYKKELLKFTNKENVAGDLKNALKGSDIFIGVSRGGLLSTEHLKLMNKRPIIFALANPDPEINPEDAIKAGAAIVATGRSDYPNQINNALVFPGLLRGALDNKVNKITTKQTIQAAIAIASLVKPTKTNLLPDIWNKNLVRSVANAIS